MSAPAIAILGGGAWGTALAILIAGRGSPVRIWMRRPESVRRMIERHDNPVHLPGITIPKEVVPSNDLACVLEGAALVIAAVPSPFARAVYVRAREHVPAGIPLLVTIKGIERDSGALPAEVAAAELGAPPTAILSGPSFAPEVARGMPTAVVVAAEDPALARHVQQLLSGGALRVYTSDDPKGVQLAGALKNVIAIAAGVATGAGLGHGATAALMTRGLAEIQRLGVALGARTETFAGLAGMGDLVLTCTGAHSRNRKLGEALGHGGRLRDVVACSASVVEGVGTSRIASDLARKHGITVPIIDEVCRVMFDDASVPEAMERLMARPLSAEAPLRAELGS